MVLGAVWCPACQQPEAVRRHGKAPDGARRYRCTSCRCTFQLRYRRKIHGPGTRARITASALDGNGIRDPARVLGIGPQTVLRGLKKAEAVSQRPPVRPDYVPDPTTPLWLGADERWSFVGHKKGQRAVQN